MVNKETFALDCSVNQRASGGNGDVYGRRALSPVVRVPLYVGGWGSRCSPSGVWGSAPMLHPRTTMAPNHSPD